MQPNQVDALLYLELLPRTEGGHIPHRLIDSGSAVLRVTTFRGCQPSLGYFS